MHAVYRGQRNAPNSVLWMRGRDLCSISIMKITIRSYLADMALQRPGHDYKLERRLYHGRGRHLVM